MNKKRRAEITDVYIKEGMMVCNAADLDKVDRTYTAIPFERPATGQLVAPPVESVVTIDQMFDEQNIVSGILSTPKGTGTNTQALIDSAENGGESVMHVFDRAGANKVERIAVEHHADGYEITADVEGDITISAGGQVVIEQGGEVKKVLTEDAVFEYQDTGDTDGGGGPESTRTTTTVSNGEVTDVKID